MTQFCFHVTGDAKTRNQFLQGENPQKDPRAALDEGQNEKKCLFSTTSRRDNLLCLMLFCQDNYTQRS